MKKVQNMTFDEFIDFLGIEESIEDEYMEDLSNDYSLIQHVSKMYDDFICFVEDSEARNIVNSRVYHGLYSSFIIGQHKDNIGKIETVSVEEMKNYGYLWDGMKPLTMNQAIELYKEDKTVYRLFNDNTQEIVKALGNIYMHGQQGGIFGIEIADDTCNIKAVFPFDEDKMCTTKEGRALILKAIENEFNLWKDKILKLDTETIFNEYVFTIALCQNIFDIFKYFTDFGYRYLEEEGFRVAFNVLKGVREKDFFTLIGEDYKNIEEEFNISDYEEIESYLKEFGARYQLKNK